MTPSRPEILARFLPAARSADLVTFDLFDTLLRRRCGPPEAVFALLSERARSVAPALAPTLAAARVAAEQEARRRAREAGHSEVSLGEIYAALAAHPLAPPDLAALQALECETEAAVLEADPEIAGLYHGLIREGVRVALVSDMYLPEACLAAILRAAGFVGHERLFLSNACRAAKADGTIWPYLRGALGLPSQARIVHLGDHPEADGSTARQAGIEAFVIPRPGSAVRAADALGFLGASAGPPAATDAERYWGEIGRHAVLPAALGLSAFIREVGERVGTDRVFFLARDGLIFQKAFEATRRDGETPSRYLWASRRCLNMAAIFDLDEDDLAYLTSGRDPLPPEAYLARIDLPLTPKVRAAIRRHFDDEAAPVATPADKARLRAVLRDLAPLVLGRARTERKALLAHLDEAGLFDGPAIVVDLGWHGSLQRSLLRLGLRLGSRVPDLVGVYLGTLADRPRTVGGEPMRSFGWLFEDGAPERDRARTVGRSVEVIELLFAAPEAGIRCVEVEGGIPRPVRQPATPAEAERIAVARAIHAAVEAAVLRLGPVARWISADSYREATLARLDALLHAPSPEDVARFSALDHAEGFGVAEYRALVGAPPAGLDPRGLLRAYRASFWPRAFLRRLPLPARVMLPVAASIQDRVWHLRRSRSLQ